MRITRQSLRLTANPSRVIARSFIPGGPERIGSIIGRIRSLGHAEVSAMVAKVVADYRQRHKDIRAVLAANCAQALALSAETEELSEDRRLLIGAYFTNEYSLESVALFNPSMILHPNQQGTPAGSVRFIMSLRACGEGHISSIEFRTGTVDASHQVSIDPPTPFALTARPVDDALYDKPSYLLKLGEMKFNISAAEPIFVRLGERFTVRELRCAIESACAQGHVAQDRELTDNLLWLAHSNYELKFPSDSDLSERVIFPVSENESRGIEDARFVRFTHPDGRVTYYATYTAYNGVRVLPQLIETSDFCHFKISTLNGCCVQNKGMALFPRKVDGQFMVASRLDGENIYLLKSDNIDFWNEAKLIHGPKYPWEFIQVGNCGSPIETEQGWVLPTHGVGPMRQYWIGALLLDLEDPSRVIGELRDPLLVPNEDERDGYVPNVVYSCGFLRHGDSLVIPYAVSDSSIRVADVKVDDLLRELRKGARCQTPHRSSVSR